jgi:hypothetical protein
MQRNVQCFQYYYKNYVNVNLFFYGGVIRGGNNTFFFNALSYLIDSFGTMATTTNNTLNMWIGISFATSHAGRDMIGFVSANSTIFDMYSLYYTAPFFDSSANILGTVDVLQTGSSNTYLAGNNTFYYWCGGSRLYDTGDTMGDEALIKKVNMSICYAVGYNTSGGTVPYSPALASNKHDYYSCFYPNIVVWETYVFLPFVMSLAIIGLLAL